LSPGVTPVLLVAEAASTKPASLLPELRAAEDAGFSTIGILSRRARDTVPTATVGHVARSQRCCTTRFRLDEHAPPVSTYGTWGEMLGAMVRASTPAVALR
jgi:hypothetical protein